MMQRFIEKLPMVITRLPLTIAALMVVAFLFGTELKYIFALAVTDFQQMHVDLYWLSVFNWLDGMSNWTLATFVFVLALLIYTATKAFVIVKHYDVDDGQYGKRLASLVAGCSLAALAPYRMTQASERMKDHDIAEEMATIRIKTISTLKINSQSLNKVGVALSHEPNGLGCVTDLSSTYILSTMKKNNLSSQ